MSVNQSPENPGPVQPDDLTTPITDQKAGNVTNGEVLPKNNNNVRVVKAWSLGRGWLLRNQKLPLSANKK